MLSPSTIDAIRELPIEKVLSDYLTLKKSGIYLKACCPFHTEKTPSFTVNEHKNTFTCYGCGAHGDAIEFVMRKDNLPFVEACKAIATNNGIPIEETEVKGKTPEQKKDEETMMELLHQAQVKYTSILNSTPDHEANS